MLFDSQMLKDLEIDVLPRPATNPETLEELHNSPLSLLEPYKDQGFLFCDSESDMLPIIFQNEEYKLFGQNDGGFYLLKGNEVLFLKSREGVFEYCNASLRNFSAVYCYIIGLAFNLKSHLANGDGELKALFEAASRKIETFYRKLEGSEIGHSHWELTRYEFEDGFFHLKPSLLYYLKQGKLELNS